jgi:ferredoxin
VAQFRITIDNTGEVFHCGSETNLLEAMEAALCKGIPVGCRNGGCGACKARVVAGRYVTRKMNRAVVSEEEQAKGYVLACKTYPQDDLKVAAADVVAKRKAGFEFSMGWQNVEPKKEA